MLPWPPPRSIIAKSRGHRVGRSIILRAAGAAVLVLAGAAAYLCLWPVPADPVSWQAPMPPGYTGEHAENTRLAGLRMIDLGGEAGPEHIAIGPDGKIYAAVESGNLLRMDRDGGKQEVFANTGGRVLGFDFDAQGRLIAADAFKGLLAITPEPRTGRSISRMLPRASLRRNGAARWGRVCSTSWSNLQRAVCSPTIPQPGKPASSRMACRSPTGLPCPPTAIPCS
jgi:hypothetical protein